MRLSIALTLAATLLLSGCAVLHRPHTYVDKTQIKLTCIKTGEDTLACNIAVVNTEKW